MRVRVHIDLLSIFSKLTKNCEPSSSLMNNNESERTHLTINTSARTYSVHKVINKCVKRVANTFVEI